MRTRIAVACVPALLALAFALASAAGDPPAPAPVLRAAVVNVLDYPSVRGDGVTDDSAAVQAVIDAHPGRTIYFPTTAPDPGAGGFLHPSYYFASTLTVPAAAGGTTLRGDGKTTLLRFAPKTPGFRVDGGNVTIRDLAIHGQAQWTAAIGHGWEEGVIPAGRYTPPGWDRPLGVGDGADGSDGVQVANGGCILSNLDVQYFGRDGINASAGDLGAFSSEVCTFFQCNSEHNRGSGIKIDGGDSNVSVIQQGNFNNNQFWSIDDQAFLSAAVIAPQANNSHIDPTFGNANYPYPLFDRLVRSGNVVTVYFAAPHGPAFKADDGLNVIRSPHDPSFVGRWRVATVINDGGGRTTSLTYPQVGPDATAGGSATGHALTLPGTVARDGATSITGVDATNIEVGMMVTGDGVPHASTPTDFRVVGVPAGGASGTVVLNCGIATGSGSPAPVSLTFSRLSGTYNVLPPDATIAAAARASNVVTVTLSAAYAPGGHPLAVGQGVALLNTPLSASTSFNGVHIVTWVSGDNTQFRFGQAGPDESVGSGAARVAAPRDAWEKAGLTGGSYQVTGSSQLAVILNPYSEGGQDQNYGRGTLLLNPVGGNVDSGSGAVIHTESANGGPGTNFAWGIATDKDGDLQYYEKVGVTFNGAVVGRYIDVLTNETIWYTRRDAGAWLVGAGEPLNGSLRTFLSFAPRSYCHMNSPPGFPFLVNTDPGTGTGVTFGDGTGGPGRATVSGGRVTLAPTADADATVGCLYMGADHRDADGNPRLCLKTPQGVKVFRCDDN